MNRGSKILVVLGVLTLTVAAPFSVPADPIDAAVQAVQQAPDPSAAIAAYANGFAIDRNNPRLYDAYVSRMVELGLPEMAYHQAQTLTTLQANNGLAWGVVAYVEARRGQMPEAISAINLAGQFTPDNKFVQHTAGELVAWYDFKADKTKVSESAKAGLAKVRSLLQQNPTFAEAYNTAHKAYENPTSTGSSPSAGPGAPSASVQTSPEEPTVAPVLPDELEAPLAPPVQANQAPAPVYEAPLVPSTSYYPDYGISSYYPDDSGIYMDWAPSYCYDWGPGWVAPAPWCWWQPCGFWGGCNFFPFGAAFAFGDFHRFHHDRFFGHDGHLGRDGVAHDRFGHEGGFWHHDAHGRNGFFGAPARPSASVAQWARAGSQPRATSAFSAPRAGVRSWNGTAQGGSFATLNSRTRMSAAVTRPGVAASGRSSVAVSGRSWTGNSIRTVSPARPAWNSSSYNSRSYSAYSAPRGNWAAPASRAPAYSYSSPGYSRPSVNSFGSSAGWRGSTAGFASRSFAGSSGGYHGGSSFAGGARSGGGFSTGGFHGGAVGGGGFHGGGFGGGSHGGGFGGGGSHGGGHR